MPDPALSLSWVNYVDAANVVLSASHEAGDGAVANLASPIVGRRWRTTTLTAWAQADLLSNQSVGVLALRFPRDTTFPTSGSVKWDLDAHGGTPGAGATYTQTVSIGADEGYGYHVHIPTAAQSVRYVRCTFTGVAGLDFIDVGRMWAGASWRPEFNMSLGYEDEWRDLSRVVQSERSGAEFVDPRSRQRVFSFGLDALSQSERDDIREMQRIAGIGGQVLFVKNPDSPARETLLGRMNSSLPIRHREIPIFAKSFSIRESL